jgi:hypothetical protein
LRNKTEEGDQASLLSYLKETWRPERGIGDTLEHESKAGQ